MKLTAIILSLAFSLGVKAKTFYKIIEGKPFKVQDELKSPHSTIKTTPIAIKFKVKKFRITRTSQGPKITFFDVCEVETSTQVLDTTGGIIQEEIFGACKALWMDKPVTVVLSGMIYDNNRSDFQGENDGPRRNFFSHLSVEGTIGGFGLGDFNLDSTSLIPFSHHVSDLSVDPVYNPLTEANYREGFTATIRYQD